MLWFLLTVGTATIDPSWSLRWDAPPECPQHNEVARRIKRAYPGHDGRAVAIEAVVARHAGDHGLAGTLVFAGQTQRFALSHAAGCEALVDKFVQYLEPFFGELAPELADPIDAEQRFTGYLRVAAQIDVGTFRSCRDESCAVLRPTAGATLAGGWSRPRLRVEFGISLHTARLQSGVQDSFGEIDTRWVQTGPRVRVCGVHERRHVDLLLCGDLGLHLLIPAPRTDDPRYDADASLRRPAAWASLRLGLAAVWWVHPRLGLRVDVAPGLHLLPAGYRATDHLAHDESVRRSLLEVGRFHATVGLGLDLRLRPAN